MLTQVPETDYLILQQMNDQDLVQFCQTSEYATELCAIPNIKKRLNTYKAYLSFNILEDIENYEFKYPMMVCKIQTYDYMYNDNEQYILSYEIYIVKETTTVIDYIADEKEGEASMLLAINQKDFDFKSIFTLNNETAWDFDINTIYDMLLQKNLEKYAKSYLINHINNAIDSLILDNTIAEFFEIMGLFYWFKTQCMFLNLVHETIDSIEQEFDLTFIQSPEGVELKHKIMRTIDLYYDLLIDYIEQL